MNRSRALIVAIMGSAALAVAPSTALGKGCGDTGADYRDTEGGAGVRITHVSKISCKAARSVVRQCIRNEKVKGWTASVDTSASPARESLRRGKQRIVWYGTAGGGPRCTSSLFG